MEEGVEQLQRKLAEIKQFHEEQRIFIQSTSSINDSLTEEQKRLFGELGVSYSSVYESHRGKVPILDEIFNSDNDNDSDTIASQNEDPIDDSDIEYPEDEEIISSPIKEYNNELVENVKAPEKVIEITQQSKKQNVTNEEKQVAKKPFLRRGSGIKKTFGIEPDKFDLKKLPRYKYQDRVQKTLAKEKKIPFKEPAKKDTKAKEVEKKQNKKPEQKQVQQSESKDLVVPLNVNLKVPESAPSQPPPKTLTEIFAKTSIDEIKETPKNPKIPKNHTWAQLFSANNIENCSINVNDILNPLVESDPNETSIFQLLEEHLKSLNQSPSSVAKLIASLQNQHEASEETIVNPDDPLIKTISDVDLEIHPRPAEIQKKIVIDVDQSESESDDDDEEKEEEYQEEKEEEEEVESEFRVRFSDNVEVMNDDQNSTILSSDLDAVELSQTSTPNERQKFQEFKMKMLGTQRILVSENVKDIEQKAYLLKVKLEEIQKEKVNIMKLRSELELEKIQLENDREDMMEKMRDEKIKMEMELHDERLKIEQQKQKLDNLMRAAKTPSKKEREEMAKLKEAADELREDMKAKETRHASAQARYRSQIKQLEKENQTLKLELEAVRKDNKKMELENARLKRDTNNKMLQEINKNIAKLAQPEANKKTEAKKKDTTRRKSEPTKPAPRKRVQSVPDISSKSSESESEENEENNSENFNPTRARMSDPLKRASSSSSDVLSEMKREIVNADGSKDIWYPNGNLKKISADGMIIRMLYYNKDIKETNIPEGTVKYYYAENNTWHTTYIDGLEILEYPNGQIEHRYKDGTVEVHFTDGSIRITNKNWNDEVKEEWRMPDGTNAKIFKNGTKILTFPNGQREVHTANHKRREYPDGTVKLVFADGTMETRYSSGRVRVKDKDGNLISDNFVK